MVKTLLSTSTVVFLLCGPALADPAPRVPAGIDLGLVVVSGNQTRHYALALVDDDCGSISRKELGKSEDSIRVCAHDGAQLRLDIDWLTRDGDREVHAKSTVVAKRGASFDLDGNGAKLSVRVQ